MRRILFALVPVLLATHAAAPAQTPAPPPGHVRVHAHIVLLDRAEARRVGLGYVQAGRGRIRLDGAGARRGRSGVRVAGEVGGIPVSAFVELARERRLVRSETRMQVLALSGAAASLGSGTLSMSAWGASRAQGPELMVTPTLLGDGLVRLEVRARLRDEVRDGYGYGADASPVDVATTLVVRIGEEATLGNLSTVSEERDAGILHCEDRSGQRDLLVVLRPEAGER